MRSSALVWLGLCLLLAASRLPVAAEPYTLRFADSAAPQLTAPVPANAWLEQQGWQQVWPPTLFGIQERLWFAGPPDQRYLQVQAEKVFYILAREVRLDPQALPWLSITWGVERFPTNAALDRYERNDRPIVITVSFGERLGTGGLLPSVPRALALFWGETERVGDNYTCIVPRDGPAEARMQCKYPHIKYLALRQGEAGSVHTDRVNLLEQFQTHFPDYWQTHQHAPPIVALSIEASTVKTQSVSSARLYSLRFSPTAALPDGP